MVEVTQIEHEVTFVSFTVNTSKSGGWVDQYTLAQHTFYTQIINELKFQSQCEWYASTIQVTTTVLAIPFMKPIVVIMN